MDAERDVVLSGHGSWCPSDGYVQLPAQLEMVFYTPHGSLLDDHDGVLIDALSPQRLPEHERVGAGARVPNYRLSPREGLGAERDIRLSDLIDQELIRRVCSVEATRIHWAACRVDLTCPPKWRAGTRGKTSDDRKKLLKKSPLERINTKLDKRAANRGKTGKWRAFKMSARAGFGARKRDTRDFLKKYADAAGLRTGWAEEALNDILKYRKSAAQAGEIGHGGEADKAPTNYGGSDDERTRQVLQQLSTVLFWLAKHNGKRPVEVEAMLVNGNVYIASNKQGVSDYLTTRLSAWNSSSGIESLLTAAEKKALTAEGEYAAAKTGSYSDANVAWRRFEKLKLGGFHGGQWPRIEVVQQRDSNGDRSRHAEEFLMDRLLTLKPEPNTSVVVAGSKRSCMSCAGRMVGVAQDLSVNLQWSGRYGRLWPVRSRHQGADAQELVLNQFYNSDASSYRTIGGVSRVSDSDSDDPDKFRANRRKIAGAAAAQRRAGNKRMPSR